MTQESERDGVINFLAKESLDGVRWERIYADKLLAYAISEDEVLQQQKIILRTSTELDADSDENQVVFVPDHNESGAQLPMVASKRSPSYLDRQIYKEVSESMTWSANGLAFYPKTIYAEYEVKRTVAWRNIRTVTLKPAKDGDSDGDRLIAIVENSGWESVTPLHTIGSSERLKDLIRSIKEHSNVRTNLDRFENFFETSKDVLIPFWPYSDDGATKAKKTKDSASSLLILFVVIWLLAFIFMGGGIHGSYGGTWWQFFKIIPFILIPLYARTSPATHLRCTPRGIRFEANLAGQTVVKKFLAWKEIDRIYLTEQLSGRRTLDRYICFKEKHWGTTKLKLEKIATAKHWEDLLNAINTYSVATLSDLDPGIFQSINVDQKDPTYTQLWLDALSAPPKRDKLQPLTSGASLKSGEYVLEHKLGTGGQGSAYLAKTKDGSKVVLKEYILPVYVDAKVRRQALERFEHEASMLSTLHHPEIVNLIDFFIEDHRGYLVLEYIDGPNLRSYVETHGPLPEEKVREYGVAMCDMLTYLHSQSPPVVHRDFTPDNIILNADGTLKLIDFMVAQQRADTAVGTVVGKHAYLPPEQFRGRATPQSDIYGLGATLFYLLTGKDPEALTSSHPILIDDTVSGEMDALVAKATDLDLSQRYQTASEMRSDLQSPDGAEANRESA